MSLPTIRALFSKRFLKWEIELPIVDAETRTRGHIAKAGWSIRYLFGKDELGEYLDFFSSHRMADDDHYRIYESGEMKELEYLRRGFTFKASIPGDKERAELEMKMHNQKATAVLAAKGFVPMTINAAILMGDFDD